jgi:hypothetical protein
MFDYIILIQTIINKICNVFISLGSYTIIKKAQYQTIKHITSAWTNPQSSYVTRTVSGVAALGMCLHIVSRFCS